MSDGLFIPDDVLLPPRLWGDLNKRGAANRAARERDERGRFF